MIGGMKADCCRWVKTVNGQNFADSIGVAEPPMTLEESVTGVLAQVCSLHFGKSGEAFLTQNA